MTDTPRRRIGIVLFNLGGPDRPEAIRPFLLNLFRDPAIIRVPPFIRPLLARWIAHRRVAPATANYALLGGKSPLLELTMRQASALEVALAGGCPSISDVPISGPPNMIFKCVIAMRYWHPMTDQAVREMLEWTPDEILLLPLYPQYSTTTTGSSLTAWREAAARAGLTVCTTALCCYFSDPGFVAATASLAKSAYDSARATLPPEVPLRVLFSAHGLPEKIIAQGDPYQHQIEASAKTVLQAWNVEVDHVVCYQSRVTPVKWISPSTEDEIARAARDKVAVLVVPIAFVSDHLETLVELDIEYAHLAKKLGVPGYFRAPVANDHPDFIAALASLARRSLARGPGLCRAGASAACPRKHGQCPHLLAELTP